MSATSIESDAVDGGAWEGVPSLVTGATKEKELLCCTLLHTVAAAGRATPFFAMRALLALCPHLLLATRCSFRLLLVSCTGLTPGLCSSCMLLLRCVC